MAACTYVDETARYESIIVEGAAVVSQGGFVFRAAPDKFVYAVRQPPAGVPFKIVNRKIPV